MFLAERLWHFMLPYQLCYYLSSLSLENAFCKARHFCWRLFALKAEPGITLKFSHLSWQLHTSCLLEFLLLSVHFVVCRSSTLYCQRCILGIKGWKNTLRHFMCEVTCQVFRNRFLWHKRDYRLALQIAFLEKLQQLSSASLPADSVTLLVEGQVP